MEHHNITKSYEGKTFSGPGFSNLGTTPHPTLKSPSLIIMKGLCPSASISFLARLSLLRVRHQGRLEANMQVRRTSREAAARLTMTLD